MSSRMLLALLPSFLFASASAVAAAKAPSPGLGKGDATADDSGSSTSSRGEYNACSSAAPGTYSRLRELTLAILPCLLPSMEPRELRLYSVLVCREPMGDDDPGGRLGRCISRLERFDCRRRGGGGGGGRLVLSLDTARGALRVECMEDVRARPGTGDEGSEVIVVRREEGGLGEDIAGRPDAESSVDEEFALDVFIVDRALP